MLRFIKFSLLLLFSILSIICSIYILYNAIRYPSVRKRLHYEIIIYISSITLLKLILNAPISLSYYSRGRLSPESDTLCRFWQYFDYATSGCIIWSMAILAIERYVMVFYSNYLRSRRQKLLFHYLPIILTNLYVIVFYAVVIILCLSHQVDHEYDIYLCHERCLEFDARLSTFNWIFNILFPIFTTILGSLILLIRVLFSRRKMQRNLRNWSKNWKMIVQLLGIAIVYALIWLPLGIVSIASIVTHNLHFENIANGYLYHLSYIVDITVPIMAFVCSPKKRFPFCQRSRVNVMDTVGGTTGQY